MIPFIIVLTVTILSMIYIDRLIKLKFKDEKSSWWKMIHIIAYIMMFIPLIGMTYLVADGNLIEIGILFIAILLYLSFNIYKKFKA